MRRETDLRFRTQAGAGMLGVIALLGVSFVLVQGTLYYKSRASAAFIASEKNKVLAQQAAEAGVEENIADLGSRRVQPHAGMADFPTYTGRPVGAGTFTTSLSLVATGVEADTVELRSLGRVASQSQSVRAKLRIKRYIDTTLTPVMYMDPDTTVVSRVVTLPETTVTTVVQDPAAMPALNTTPAYQACVASAARKCDICHIPPGSFENRHVVNVNRHSIDFHIDCHGDYVTTDGTCDLYKPRNVLSVAWTSTTLFDTTIVDNTVYDTVVVIDTLAKVQILSWK
jgi:hypothetical protein